MFKKTTLFLVSFSLIGCASVSQSKVKIVRTIDTYCKENSIVTSVGFSFIPSIAKRMSENVLKENAEKFKSDTLIITKSEGTFQVDLTATGYNCSI